jgi:hypothetical protein
VRTALLIDARRGREIRVTASVRIIGSGMGRASAAKRRAAG